MPDRGRVVELRWEIADDVWAGSEFTIYVPPGVLSGGGDSLDEAKTQLASQMMEVLGVSRIFVHEEGAPSVEVYMDEEENEEEIRAS
jgi:hypothetical protein